MKRKNRTAKFMLIAIFGIAVCVLIIGLFFSGKQGNVITCISEINRGTTITEDNFNDMFEVKGADDSIKPSDAVTDKESVIGKTFRYDISEGTILTEGMLADGNSIGLSMNNPVAAGIKATDISQFVGGIIRKGDYIDISVVDKNTGECINVMNSVYVVGAYNSDGTEIENGEGCAMLLNVLIEKESESYLNTMLSMGTIRICRLERGRNG